MDRKQYPIDLIEYQWYIAQGLLPKPKSGAGKRGCWVNQKS